MAVALKVVEHGQELGDLDEYQLFYLQMRWRYMRAERMFKDTLFQLWKETKLLLHLRRLER